MSQNMGSNNSSPVINPVKLLIFSASLRKASLNARLAKVAARIIENAGAVADWAEMADFVAQAYDQDLEDDQGPDPAANLFKSRLESNDAFVIVSPEYNASIPGVLKNTLDWASRFKPQPFHGKQGLLLSASPSMVGGNRGLWALRIPLEHLGARIFPDMFSLALAHKAFSPSGDIIDSMLQNRLELTIKAFIEQVEAVKHFPCVKKAWFEFLGENTDLLTDRSC